MSRNNFESLINSDFDATVHFSFEALNDLISNGMLHGIIPSSFKSGKNEIRLRPPEIAVIPLDNITPAELPDGLSAPQYPENREEQDLLFDMNLPVTIASTDEKLALLNIDHIEAVFTITARPYFSGTEGIGLVFYELAIDITGTSPNESDIFHSMLESQLTSEVYPFILSIISGLKTPLPDLNGLEAKAVLISGNFDNNTPPTLSLGLGGRGRQEDLLPLLDNEDGLMLTVSKKLFDKEVAAFNSKFPKKSYNWDKNQWEDIRYVHLSLGDNAINLSTKLIVDQGVTTPDATVTVNGPVSFSFEGEGLDRYLKADGSRLDVDAEISWAFRIFADIFTLGLAEIKISPALRKGEKDARSEVVKQLEESLNSTIMGSYPSGVEIFGRDNFMTRESAVLWSGPNVIRISPEGFMVGGPAMGGVKGMPRNVVVTKTYRPEHTIQALALENSFYLSKERAIQLWKEHKLRIRGITLVHGKTGDYFRDKREPKEELRHDNLTEKPYFNPAKSKVLKNADDFEPLESGERYRYNEGNTIVKL